MVDVAVGQIWEKSELHSGKSYRLRIDEVSVVPGAGGSQGVRGTWLNGSAGGTADEFFAAEFKKGGLGGWRLVSAAVAGTNAAAPSSSANVVYYVPGEGEPHEVTSRTAVHVGFQWLTDTLNELERLRRRETELQTRMSDMVRERQAAAAKTAGEVSSPAEQREADDRLMAQYDAWFYDAWVKNAVDARTPRGVIRSMLRQAREEERANERRRWCVAFGYAREKTPEQVVAERDARQDRDVSAERAEVNAEWVQACFDRMHCVVELPPDKALAMIERVVSNERVTALTHAREERDEAVRKARVEALDGTRRWLCYQDHGELRDKLIAILAEQIKEAGGTGWGSNLERDQPASEKRCACDFSTDSPKIDTSCHKHGKNRPGQGMAEPTTEAPEKHTGPVKFHRMLSGPYARRLISAWEVRETDGGDYWHADVVEKRVAEAVANVPAMLEARRKDREITREILGATDREFCEDAARRVVAERDAARREVFAMNNAVLESGKRAETAERERDEAREAIRAMLTAVPRSMLP